MFGSYFFWDHLKCEAQPFALGTLSAGGNEELLLHWAGISPWALSWCTTLYQWYHCVHMQLPKRQEAGRIKEWIFLGY